MYWPHSYWLQQKGSILTKIIYDALVYIKYSTSDAMRFEIIWQFRSAFLVAASNDFLYLEACGSCLGSIYQQRILLQPTRDWNHCCHVSEHNVHSLPYSLKINSKQHFKHFQWCQVVFSRWVFYVFMIFKINRICQKICTLPSCAFLRISISWLYVLSCSCFFGRRFIFLKLV